MLHYYSSTKKTSHEISRIFIREIKSSQKLFPLRETGTFTITFFTMHHILTKTSLSRLQKITHMRFWAQVSVEWG